MTLQRTVICIAGAFFAAGVAAPPGECKKPPDVQCNSGSIDFVARCYGPDDDGDSCEATRRITKSCK